MPFLRNYMLKYAQNRPIAIQDDEDGMPLPLKRMQNSQEKIKQDSLNRAQEILHPLHWLVDIDLIDTIRYPHWMETLSVSYHCDHRFMTKSHGKAHIRQDDLLVAPCEVRQGSDQFGCLLHASAQQNHSQAPVASDWWIQCGYSNAINHPFFMVYIFMVYTIHKNGLWHCYANIRNLRKFSAFRS